jgi:ATP-dependent RNA helicase RhlE
MSFASLNLPEPLLRAVADLGFTVPTPIQLEAIPPALAGRDMIACAMTGSGKTAAFLLPILNRLMTPSAKRAVGPRALIVSPTRELAAQTAEQLTALCKHTRLRGAAIFGGVGMGPQEAAFRNNFEVLVATPGRLLDHLERPYARLDSVEVLVLDEADRMLDMGFIPDIKRILALLPKERQNLMFSATMPPPIAALTRTMLHQPVQIAVDREAKPATGVTQAIYPVREDLKPYLLLELLRREPIKNVLVFTRTKHRANRLADLLDRNGVACERIHGNRSQAQRTEALARFKAGKIRVLVATDIAARGIDVEALSHVVNFDVPNVAEDYIHRVGRTARAELTGEAWTFVAEQERGDLVAIERAVGARLNRVTLEGFDYTAKPTSALEVPLAQRIAEIRARKAEERGRAKANAERRAGRGAAAPAAAGGRPAGARAHGRPAHGRPGSRPASPAAAPHAAHGAMGGGSGHASPDRRLGSGAPTGGAAPVDQDRRPFGRPGPAGGGRPGQRPAGGRPPASAAGRPVRPWFDRDKR